MNKDKGNDIGFLIFPGFPMACLTSMIEPLRAANEISDTETFRWKIVSEDGARVKASARVWFEPDIALGEAEDLTQLFLLSAPSSVFADPQGSNGKLRRMARHGMVMGAISGGVFPMARAGLLEGHCASVHWCYAAAFAVAFPDIAASDDVIARDRRRVTVSGAAAAFDLALLMIEESLGGDVATEVACWFQHPLMRGEGVLQRKPTFNAVSTDDMLPPILRKAVGILADHIEDPVRITDVADAVGMSVRQLERQFKVATGLTPLHYYRALRMKHARQLMLYSNDSVTQVAVAVGFNSPAAMVRNYRDVFGVHPSADRAKINMFRVRENAVVPRA